ncbi:peptide deformylase [Streptomyces sp. NPDC020801]|uniref:peptide deformylase n=1 Tax=Streptomyces sp. NPDC020801 TaxID=3365093 RepID=UPI0037A2627B
MRDLGVVQHGASILTEPARALDLPAERTVDELFAAIERIGQIPSPRGRGIAAPQIGIARAAAVVLPADDAPAVILLSPRITDRSEETDEQYEGCLSFFDVRGLVPRPLKITVEATALTGESTTTVYERGLARLIHPGCHLDGLPYTAHMRTGVAPSPWRNTVRPAGPGRTSKRLAPGPCHRPGSVVTGTAAPRWPTERMNHPARSVVLVRLQGHLWQPHGQGA